jgi:hypothetical protein
MALDRRSVLRLAALAPLLPANARAAGDAPNASQANEQPDYTLRIATGLVELAPEHVVSTTLYNGQFPRTAAALHGRQARRHRCP